MPDTTVDEVDPVFFEFIKECSAAYNRQEPDSEYKLNRVQYIFISPNSEDTFFSNPARKCMACHISILFGHAIHARFDMLRDFFKYRKNDLICYNALSSVACLSCLSERYITYATFIGRDDMNEVQDKVTRFCGSSTLYFLRRIMGAKTKRANDKHLV